jgi:cytochrome c biogenesis protein CcmG/thiol:disulfide interchange protein DsbE
MNWKNGMVAALVVLPLLVVLAMSFGHDPHAVPSVLEGKPAPHFALADLADQPFTSEGLQGKPAVLNFWATWCYPCQAEHGLLQDAARHYGDRVQFLGVIYQDTAEAVRKYLATHANAYPQLMDPNSRTAIDFGVAGVPESFILNARGDIVHKQAGVLTLEVLRGTLDALLAQRQGGNP